jgi:hypothetical protein
MCAWNLRRLVWALPVAMLGVAGSAHGQFVLDQSQPSAASRQIEPVTSPYTFESPYVQSNIRPVYLWHFLPKSSALGGGDLRVAALQLRYQVDPRTALILTKSGHASLDPGEGLESDRGWVDLAGGIKFALIPDDGTNLSLTPGITYEATNGDEEVLQGKGTDVWRPFLSAALPLDDAFTLMGSIGYNYTVDKDDEPRSFDYHVHLRWALTPTFIPLVEVNGIHYLDDADAVPADFEVGDYGNIGADDVKGNNVITGAIGARFKITETIHFGAAYEAPLTSRQDLFAERLTFDLVIRF